MTVEEVAEELGLPLSELDALTTIPAVSRAMLDVKDGAGAEQAAARHDLPWLDDGPMSGVDWESLLEVERS